MRMCIYTHIYKHIHIADIAFGYMHCSEVPTYMHCSGDTTYMHCSEDPTYMHCSGDPTYMHCSGDPTNMHCSGDPTLLSRRLWTVKRPYACMNTCAHTHTHIYVHQHMGITGGPFVCIRCCEDPRLWSRYRWTVKWPAWRYNDERQVMHVLQDKCHASLELEVPQPDSEVLLQVRGI